MYHAIAVLPQYDSDSDPALATLVEYIRTQELAGNVEVLTLARLVEKAY